MSLLENVTFILGHTWGAAAAALFFAAGAACAIPVLRHRVRFLMATASRFLKILRHIYDTRPSTFFLGLFIFVWNGTIIGISMLTGLVPWLPVIMVFILGLNVMLTSILGQKAFQGEHLKLWRPSLFGRACAILTFLLELPCLWFSIAMGLSMEANLLEVFRGEGVEDIRKRVAAYVIVILPLLLISALAEAYAVNQSLRGNKASKDEEKDEHGCDT